MGAPIVVKGAQSRLVYFPAGDDRWFGYQTGREYRAESYANVTNKITDQVPLFIREGYFLLRQDTTDVTKTSQLNNVFHIRGALHATDSSLIPTRYYARGSILSIGDYNDETKLSLCLIEGCEYSFYVIINMHNSGEVNMDFETVYTGGRKLNQEQRIESLTFYYRTNKTLTHKFDTPIIINETRRQNFTFWDKHKVEEIERERKRMEGEREVELELIK